MKIVVLLLFLLMPLFATALLNHMIYEKPDRIDLMLTFDQPYEGKITKTQTENDIILSLNNMIDNHKPFSRKIHSSIAQNISITAHEGKMIIEIMAKDPLNVNASKTVDNTGLRIRIQKRVPVTKSLQGEDIQPIPTPVTPEKQTFNFGYAFLKIIFVLGLMIAFLWAMKKWLEKKGGSGNWLFSQEKENPSMQILAQKPIDMKNKMALVRFEDKKYLLLLGENNLLLDRFEDDQQEAFETLLQKNSKTLGDYLEK